VIRGGRPVRRRLWWRAGLVVVGVGLLFFAHEVPTQTTECTGMVALGASALLVGAITLQTAVAAASSQYAVPSPRSVPGQFMLQADPAISTRATVSLRRSGVVHGLYMTTTVDMTTSIAHWQDGTMPVEIASCEAIQAISGVRDRVDGDVFTLPGRLYIAPGTRLINFTASSDFVATATPGGQWTMPAHARTLSGSVDLSAVNGAVLATPKAFSRVKLAPGTSYTRLAWLVLRMSSTPMVLDWADIGASGGAAVGLVLLVTAATLPALRNATRLSALRTE
jgi:hypothetical protein